MDITLARTFLAIIEGGSFKAASERLNVTQSAVSLRVKTLEEQLSRVLFDRGKAGAVLTPAGMQFHRHALAMVRVWEHARLDVSLAEAHTDHLAIGGQPSLWEGFLLPWIRIFHRNHPNIAISASMAASTVLMERISEGTLDLAIVYRALARPGLSVEHLFDDELVLAASGKRKLKCPDENYIFMNWGPEFAADHAEAYPGLATTGLHFDLGAIGISYLLETASSGYFPLRIAKPYVKKGQLTVAPRARKFLYPVYVVYPADADKDAFAPVLSTLREAAKKLAGK